VTTTESAPGCVARWVESHLLSASDVDCAITVMLKILDGKCKMASEEKRVMAWLYDAVRGLPAQRFGDDEHALIARGRAALDEPMREQLYERRVLAESMISRPVMKAFKAMIRQQGLFECLAPEMPA